MARYTGAVCRLCRREGQKLFLKGDRCYSRKCSFDRRSYAPGQHGQGRKKVSEYGKQLRTKQIARRYYGVLEGQFRRYFELAEKMPGVTGENLLAILESRLDNVIYRLGLASSRAQARQLVLHGHFTVDGRKVNIPSYLTKVGQVISVKESSRQNENIKQIFEVNSSRPVPQWMEMNRDALEAKVVAMPSREDIELPIEETLIVELYSK
ncbi:MAG TPA: 30S ribosomal protein S4 [Candidatus Avimonas sp.]|jgi:small subunit ribosomal protein S4|nr:30S ribosomal protein S4 [Clostridiales bacterium]HOB36603.1 30S ribosomal protein S4 [Candidatus Avimonas sp.]HQA16068.1 30S ribosomal protein S4 [Candidatus Avimonas sp.]HQD38030.1 30S ribosomal protein S4 [Candidatus Avimonas sp.]